MLIIAIFHCPIQIIQRSKGKSAVAAAAYRSGEKLVNEWDGMTHDYTHKGGVVHTEIMLPSHAHILLTIRPLKENVARLCRAPLLILDDFGMERGTNYGLEQVYNVIDSRYRSRRPLIVTTNLSLQDLQHPQDTAHARIYDRLLEMCAPIRFSGERNQHQDDGGQNQAYAP